MRATQPGLASQPGRRSGDRPDLARDILDAAYRLVAEKGESFTTQELVHEAGVALQTFYRYYDGKDQLLLAVIADMTRSHCENLDAQAQQLDDPVARLELYLRSTVDALQSGAGTATPRFMTSEHWRLHQMMPEAMAAASKPYADLVQRELVAGQQAGTLAPRDPQRDAWMITKFVIAIFHHYAFLPDDPALPTLADDLCEFCLTAVGRRP